MHDPSHALGPWSSTALPAAGATTVAGWRAAWEAAAHAGEEPGGDRFAFALGPEGALLFLVADAHGHGAGGDAVWQRLGPLAGEAWAAFVGGGALPAFVDALDEGLHAAGDSLCLSVGRWQPSGALELATCGFGVHALVDTAAGPFQAEPEQSVGLKLGWFGAARRRELPRGLLLQRLAGVQRVSLLSDGLLPMDDHRDPAGALDWLRRVHRRVAGLGFEEVLPTLTGGAPAPPLDDVSALVLERSSA